MLPVSRILSGSGSLRMRRPLIYAAYPKFISCGPQPPFAGTNFLRGLAPREVYRYCADYSNARWSLTPPFHPYPQAGGIVSVILSVSGIYPGSRIYHPARYPLEFGLSSSLCRDATARQHKQNSMFNVQCTMINVQCISNCTLNIPH